MLNTYLSGGQIKARLQLRPAYIYDSNRLESIHVHFLLNRFASTESIERIFIESINKYKISSFFLLIIAIFLYSHCNIL